MRKKRLLVPVQKLLLAMAFLYLLFAYKDIKAGISDCFCKKGESIHLSTHTEWQGEFLGHFLLIVKIK